MVPLSSKKTQSWRKLWEKAPNFPGGKLFSSLPSPGPEDFSVSNILLTERSQVSVWQPRRYDGDTLQDDGACRVLAAAEISGACSALQRGLAAAAAYLHLNARCEEETLHLPTLSLESGVRSHHSPSPPRPRPAGPIRRSRVRRSRSY